MIKRPDMLCTEEKNYKDKQAKNLFSTTVQAQKTTTGEQNGKK
jgi:hypothetical protein